MTARPDGRSLPAEPVEHSSARLLEQVSDQYMLLDADFRIVTLNEAAERGLGRPRAELVGRSHWEVFPASVGSEAERQYRRVRDERVEAHFAQHYVGEGYDKYVEVDAYPTDEGGVALFWRDVSERVRTEEALRESLDRYRTLFDSIDEGFCVIEMLFDGDRPVDYRFVEANPAFEQQTGLVNAVGRTARELVPQLEEHWFATYGRVAVTGEPSRFQLGSDAMGRWFDVYAFRVGRPADRRVALLFSDVSEARATERDRDRLLRALEVERARLAYVFQRAPAFLALLRGPAHVVEFVNEAYLQLVGHRNPVGLPVAAALPEIVDQGFVRLLDGVLATGEPWLGREVPVRLQRTPGAPLEERYLDLLYLPLVEGDGTRSGVIAHGTDVTAQVLARRELEQARDRADRLQALTAALAAATTPEAVADVVVSQGIAATGATTALLAVRLPPDPQRAPDAPPEAMLLRAVGVESVVRERYARFPITAAGPGPTALRTGHAFFLESRDAIHAQFPDARDILDSMGMETLATVPLAVGGDVVAAMSFSFRTPRRLDEDDREFFHTLAAQAAQALERARLLEAERSARATAEAARAEAEAANRTKSEFLAVMSHELRTPLNAIGGYAELMEMGIHGPVTTQQLDALARIQRSQRHLLGLINEVLNYARLESGAVAYALRPTAVADVVTAVASLIEPQREARHIALDVRLPEHDGEPPVHVLADPEKLQQILLNLLSNAVKFTPEGGRVTVSLAAEPDASGLAVLQVGDTGIGIPGDKLAAIFEPFVQVRADLTRTTEGTGLGLAISRDLARGMGGDLTVQSVQGAGSTFTLAIPRSPPP